MSAVKSKIDQMIKVNKVFMVSKSYCPFCNMAKNVLAKCDIAKEDMKIMEIEDDPDCGEIQDYMAQLTGSRTVTSGLLF